MEYGQMRTPYVRVSVIFQNFCITVYRVIIAHINYCAQKITVFDAQFNYCALIISIDQAVLGGQWCATYPAFGKGSAVIFKPASPSGMRDAASIISKCNLYFVTSHE